MREEIGFIYQRALSSLAAALEPAAHGATGPEEQRAVLARLREELLPALREELEGVVGAAAS
jgi:hypothetical protein